MKRVVVILFFASYLSVFATEPSFLEVGADVSLRGVLSELAETFAGSVSNIQVRLNLAPSGVLREKIAEGKEVLDVFIATSQGEIAVLAKLGKVYDVSQTRLGETYVVLVSAWPVKGNQDWTELAETQWKRMVIANPETTMSGVVAQNLLGAEGFLESWSGQIIYENSSEKVLDWIKRAKADAGVLYNSDAFQLRPRETFHMFELDPMRSFPVIYYGATLSVSSHVEESGKFLNFISAEAQRKIWQKWGFQF
ncbi:MAG: molybdate ABC transporter substrate-binding protein [Verrucomicrobiia bacterium]